MNPFSAAPMPQGQGNLLSPAAQKRLAKFLREFSIESDPGIFVEPNGNGIKLRLDPTMIGGGATSSGVHPFKVTGSAGALRVWPGSVTIDTEEGIDTTFTPVIMGLPLDANNTNAGRLNISAGATGYVCLLVEYYASSGAKNLPFQIVYIDDFAIEETQLDRINGTNGDGSDAFLYVKLCRVVNGTPVVSGNIIRSSLHLRFNWNELWYGMTPQIVS